MAVDSATFTVGSGAVIDAAFLVDEVATGTVSEGQTGVARMTVDRRQITSAQYVDGSAMAAGSSYVSAIGAVVDDQATTQAAEGSVGYCRMSVDRALFVTGRVKDQEGASSKPHVLMVGGVVRSTAASYGEGTAAVARMDTSGNLQVNLANKIAGEDQTNDVLKVEQQFSYTRISTATTTVVKASAGFLHAIVFGKHVAAETVTVYDNTAGSGTIAYKYTEGASVLSDNQTIIVDAKMPTGITVVTDQATDVTFIWR